MRSIPAIEITNCVKHLFLSANFNIGSAMRKALEEARENERSPLGQSILTQIYDNDALAKRDRVAICQDTGMAVVFIQLGQEVQVVDGDFNDAINEGVRQAYAQGYLRKSVVKDPLFDRANTKDNTPAIIHVTLVKGDKIKIDVMPKGFGSENMSAIKLFAPSVGVEGVRKFILDTVEKAGPNACPPMIVGIGIGGTFEKAALIAKQAVLRTPGEHNPDPKYANFEIELLKAINKLGIGPAGLGGSTTALAVNIETFPTHIASIPVAVNISCHASRHASSEI